MTFNPTKSADSNYQASILISSHLLKALRHGEGFRSVDHRSTIAVCKSELVTRNKATNEKALASILSGVSCDDRRTILRGKDTGRWLSITPSTVNGTELSMQEFRDSLLLRYARSPPDLPSECDGCGKECTVRHALAYKVGGLVIRRHDEIRDVLIDIASKVFPNAAIRDEPKIHTGRVAEEEKATEQTTNNVRRNFRKHKGEEERGDILIRGLYANGTDCIIDVRVTDLDAKCDRNMDPEKVLQKHERERRRRSISRHALGNVDTSLPS